MKNKIQSISTLLFAVAFFATVANGSQRAVLVHVTNSQIKNLNGSVQLKLMKVWGGEKEKDENKFFKTPCDVAINNSGWTFISDQYNHQVKVFDSKGQHVRTIGQKGRGPGDLYGPSCLALAPNGDLLVSEFSGIRLQLFGRDGKSKDIVKRSSICSWIGVTSKNQYIIHCRALTIEKSRLLYILSNKGKIVKGIGTFHDKNVTGFTADIMQFVIDDKDNIYAMKGYAPVIRKYALDGSLMMAITFELPITVPVTVGLKKDGREIVVNDGYMIKGKDRLSKKGQGHMVQSGTRKPIICYYMAVDSRGRIFVITLKRRRSEEEKSAYFIGASTDRVKVFGLEKALAEKVDYLQLLVFAPNGEILARSDIGVQCSGIYVKGNRLFIIDKYIRQQIQEYEITFNPDK